MAAESRDASSWRMMERSVSGGNGGNAEEATAELAEWVKAARRSGGSLLGYYTEEAELTSKTNGEFGVHPRGLYGKRPNFNGGRFN